MFIRSMLVGSAMLSDGALSFFGSTDRAEAVYRIGETMVFNIQLRDGSKPVGGVRLKWSSQGDDGKTVVGEAMSDAAKPLVVETSLACPGFVHVIVNALGADGQPLKGADGNDLIFEGGAGVALEELRSAPEPHDFDAFWARQKAKLAVVPPKATLVEIPCADPAFEAFDVKVDCAGGMPVSGYLLRPKGAAAKSLKACVGFMGYGVDSARPEPRPGAISFNVNAHGIENGKDADYYAQLKVGGLRHYTREEPQPGRPKGYRYVLKAAENSDPDACYLNGMLLRALRALEFVKSRPEWNGEILEVVGGSQGGFQALAAAGLDPDVTFCRAEKPWSCDLGGPDLGRLWSSFRSEPSAALGYYDPANHAKRFEGAAELTSGLGDYICPPSGITVVYNNLKGAKRVEYIQGSTHGYTMPDAQKFTLGAQ